MLEKVNLQRMIMKDEYKQESAGLKLQLANLQRAMKEAGFPVIILFDGWGASGKGSMISDIILTLDPRGYKVYSTLPPTQEEAKRPFLWRFWNKIPAKGQFSIFDRSWYQDVTVGRIENGMTDEQAFKKMDSIKTFERQLTDDGYLIIKFFLHISKKEQKQRFDNLESSKNTNWRVTAIDKKRNRQYSKYYVAFDDMLEYTDVDYAPWHVIGCHNRNSALSEIYRVLVKEISKGIQIKKEKDLQAQTTALPEIDFLSRFHLVEAPKLKEIDLDRTLEEERYKDLLNKEQKNLKKLHNRLYRKKVPLVVVYEGWDAAGKGGNIKRLAASLDPRGYEVIPISAPTEIEKAHHYLWRFWQGVPKAGHIAIFDRSWYGRVMVERVEGFASPQEWSRAYNEINEFERELRSAGAIIVKFWLQIDKDEQLRRFQERENTPGKQWKLTQEDWRNREKWDQYEEAVDDMLKYTSTDFAPWTVIESQDKKFGRIKAIRTVINAIEERLL
ncbi:polyphosphate:AMP phosphotransferase [Youxingia wuxianensis]|uniref:Polyphosphate:AMP phosphotransferase n=1 Tax=Youxingia wuxianensis TaxID=2763678 RepID=A0A926IIG5_9FIRM|nr:polyphosphate:AMP phosphotransferase [Youxingia wuxianensis]MBC8586336.1 polyphosphate:AMP phosphotransferase [Youxingia wuxianensis]